MIAPIKLRQEWRNTINTWSRWLVTRRVANLCTIQRSVSYTLTRTFTSRKLWGSWRLVKLMTCRERRLIEEWSTRVWTIKFNTTMKWSIMRFNSRTACCSKHAWMHSLRSKDSKIRKIARGWGKTSTQRCLTRRLSSEGWTCGKIKGWTNMKEESMTQLSRHIIGKTIMRFRTSCPESRKRAKRNRTECWIDNKYKGWLEEYLNLSTTQGMKAFNQKNINMLRKFRAVQATCSRNMLPSAMITFHLRWRI